MGKYSVPEEIRKLKPKGSTMVKAISGGYYVYEFTQIKGEDGKKHTKMGKNIGSIKEGIGFVPNDNYYCDFNRTVFDFGDYAVLIANSKKTLALLNECFNPHDAALIYTISIIYILQQFCCIKAVKDCFEISILSLKYPTLLVDDDSISKLYVTLGSKSQSVLAMEKNLIASCSNEIAIDCHVLENKSSEVSEFQGSLFMAYDVNTKIPLISRFFPESLPDKVSLKEIIGEEELHSVLFVIDQSFYSEENLKLITKNNNNYIVPLDKNLAAYKQAVSSVDKLPYSFLYDDGGRNNCVEYKDEIKNGKRILVFKNSTEAANEKVNYMRHIEKKDKGYTEEKLKKIEPLLGVIVLQTSLQDKEPEKIYRLYKNRRTKFSFYKFPDDDTYFNDLCQQDYYAAQGLAFILQVCGLIYREFEEAAAGAGEQAEDCLRFARKIKAQKLPKRWMLANCEKKHSVIFKKLNASLNIEAYL